MRGAALRHTVPQMPFEVHLPRFWRLKHLFSPLDLEKRSSADSTRYECYRLLRTILLEKRLSYAHCHSHRRQQD
jgi:hypothetical protein